MTSISFQIQSSRNRQVTGNCSRSPCDGRIKHMCKPCVPGAPSQHQLQSYHIAGKFDLELNLWLGWKCLIKPANIIFTLHTQWRNACSTRAVHVVRSALAHCQLYFLQISIQLCSSTGTSSGRRAILHDEGTYNAYDYIIWCKVPLPNLNSTKNFLRSVFKDPQTTNISGYTVFYELQTLLPQVIFSVYWLVRKGRGGKCGWTPPTSCSFSFFMLLT